MDSIPKRATFAAAMLLALAQLLTYGAVQPVAAVGEQLMFTFPPASARALPVFAR